MVQTTPTSPPPEVVYVEKKKKPIYRRWWFIALAALAVIMAISIGTGGDDADTTSTPAASADAPAAEEPAAASAAAGIGTPVEDGKFEFTVVEVKAPVSELGDPEFLGEAAQGEFVQVVLSVRNIGDEAQILLDSEQYAFSGETKFSSSSAAGLAVESNTVWLTEINPGNTIQGTIVFDVPVGTALDKLELHDSMFSGGVDVSLR